MSIEFILMKRRLHSLKVNIRNALKILVEKAKNIKGKEIIFHDHILISDFDANRKHRRRRYYDHIFLV
jgi:hypothetical protein